MNRFPLIHAVALSFVGAVASAQPTLTYAPADSWINLDCRARADDFMVAGGSEFHRDQSASLASNYEIGHALYQRGASVNPISVVNGPGSRVTDSSAAYIGMNGLNTRVMSVDYRAVTLGSASGTPSYQGVANAANYNGFTFSVNLNGSPEGFYTIRVEWNYTANGGTQSEQFAEDSSSASGSLMVFDSDHWENLFNVTTMSPPSNYPQSAADHGSWTGDLYVPAAGAGVYIAMNMNAGNSFYPSGQGQHFQDLCGSEFIGGFTVTISGGGAAPCVADVDDGSGTGARDGGVTIDDLIFYLQLFGAGDSRADIDDGSATATRDGGVTIDDLLYYLARFAAGC